MHAKGSQRGELRCRLGIWGYQGRPGHPGAWGGCGPENGNRLIMT